MKTLLKFSAIGCGGLMGLLVVLVIIGSLLGDPDTSTSLGDPDTSTSPSSPQIPAISSNDTVNAKPNHIEKGDRAITLTSFEIVSELASNNEFLESVSGPLVVVKFTSENIGNTTGNFAFSQYAIEDSQGRTYNEVNALEYTMWRDSQGYQARTEEYFPGESRDDIAAFRIAPDANGFKFSWKGSSVPITVSGE